MRVSAPVKTNAIPPGIAAKGLTAERDARAAPETACPPAEAGAMRIQFGKHRSISGDCHAVLKAWAMLLATALLAVFAARPAGNAVISVLARWIGF